MNRFFTTLFVTLAAIAAFGQTNMDIYLYGHNPDWGTGNKFAATIGDEPFVQIALWDLKTGRKVIIGDGDFARFSPDGSKLAFKSGPGYNSGSYKVANSTTGQIIDSFEVSGARGQFAWLNNGQLLFARRTYDSQQNGSSGLWIYNTVGGSLSNVAYLGSRPDAAIGVDAGSGNSNDWLTVGTADKITVVYGTGLWWQGDLFLLDGITGTIRQPRFRRIDGTAYALYAKSFGSHELPSTVVLMLPLEMNPIWSTSGTAACWSPDGQWIAVAKGHGNEEIEIVRAPNGL